MEGEEVEVYAAEPGQYRSKVMVMPRGTTEVTRLLLEDILSAEKEHVDYLETQFALVSLGLQEYLSLPEVVARGLTSGICKRTLTVRDC